MDQFIYTIQNAVCEGINSIGAAKLYSDLCVIPHGRDILYYFIIGFLVVSVLSIIASLGAKSKTPNEPQA